MTRLKGMKDLASYWEEMGRIESDADRVYRRLLARLFSGEYKALMVMKLREVVDGLESAMNAFERVAKCIESIAVTAAYPGASIYRFIPNMPTEVRRGVLCYVPGPRAAEGPEDEILELFGRAGTVIRLDDEPLIEPAMALMSCGPAFMALVAETFADAGAAHGLDPDVAMRMVVETMGGTAEYLAQHDYDGPDLRARVATPGGTTERGLITLEERGLRDVTRAAVDAVVEATR